MPGVTVAGPMAMVAAAKTLLGGTTMKDDKWTTTDIANVFRFKDRKRTVTSILGAEDRGAIPKASRLERGRVSVRFWPSCEIPKIGKNLGFMQPLPSQEVISVYTAKGGVLKTTIAHSLARICALNGIKTLIVGLDIQCSITRLAIPRNEVRTIEEADREKNRRKGLYHFFFEDASVQEIVRKTSLPTLDIIPENPEVNDLERRLRGEKRQEYVFQDRLMEALREYEVVVFDNGPSWNLLVENSLVCATTVISPAGCDIGTYEALQTNLKRINEFQKIMRLHWGAFVIAPTLLENTNISQEVYASYLSMYRGSVLPKPIRRAAKGQEAHYEKRTALEMSPKSPLAGDYFDLVMELWRRIRAIQESTAAA